MFPSSMFRLLALVQLAALAGCSLPSGGGAADISSLALRRLATAAAHTPIPCRALTEMRDLGTSLSTASNPKTGDKLEYAVVGDAAVSDDLIVFFPGTGQTVADWPMQMITNRAASPNIVGKVGYRSDQDAPVSLCHNYRLVLFDYPGVGLAPYRAAAGLDAVASDVDAMLEQIGRNFGISTAVVDPLGWSLGTAFGLKYAFLSPVSRPQRQIRNVMLVAGSPGGSEQAQVGADNAPCVKTLFAAAETATGSVGKQIKIDASKLLFPYKGQTRQNNGTNSDCTANVTSSSVTLSVTPNCTESNGCNGFLLNGALGLETAPWSKTDGVSGNTYVLQRYEDNDFDVAYCAKAAPGFRSIDCSAYGPIKQSITNGGFCKTNTINPDVPATSDCVRLNITGHVLALDGHEDIFTQWTYDRALVNGLNAQRSGLAQFMLYPGKANHGLMLQHPGWVQVRFANLMSRASSKN